MKNVVPRPSLKKKRPLKIGRGRGKKKRTARLRMFNAGSGGGKIEPGFFPLEKEEKGGGEGFF